MQKMLVRLIVGQRSDGARPLEILRYYVYNSDSVPDLSAIQEVLGTPFVKMTCYDVLPRFTGWDDYK